jgi:hypothetical protein
VYHPGPVNREGHCLSLEDELNELAWDRERTYEAVRQGTIQQHPSKLLRQLRAYLAELADHGKLKRTYDLPRSVTRPGDVTEVICDGVEFASDSLLSFSVLLESSQQGWLLTEFEFHLALQGRRVGHVRIHLTRTGAHDPLRVPRCHIHIDNSDPHIPFPIMNPRLTVHLMCEHIEPEIGLDLE